MTKFNTGNGVGSADPRDLHDTATVADNLVNGQNESYPDRLGNSRKSWASIESQAAAQESEFNSDQSTRASEFDSAQTARESSFESDQSDRESRFNSFIAASGYIGTGTNGAVEDYAAGIELTEYNQIVRDPSGGEFWRLSGGVALPYTTTGSGLPEGGAFVGLGDAVLRQDPAIQAHLRPLVIVASGQSNMDGAGDGGEMPGENSLVQMFDLTTRAFRAVSYTTPIDRKNVNNGATMKIPSAVGKNNLAFSFCHAAFEETGRPVYLIIVSNGGTHIGRWVGSDQDSVAGYEGPWGPVGTAKPLYVELKAAVEEALQIIGASKIDAFLWHQGETKRPGFESPSDYEADFSALRTQLAAETWWSDSTQLIAGEQIIGSYYRNAENYNDIWRAFNDNGDPRIKAVSQEGLAMNAVVSAPDSVHFDGASLYELGRRYWRAYLGDKAALARRGDPETTLFGANSQTLDWSSSKFNVAVRIDPYRERVIENVAPAAARAWGGYQAGLRVVNNTSCAVVHNSDGTFDVTPNGLVARNWSFDVEQFTDVGPAVSRQASNDTPARITGAVDLTKREKFRLWLDGDTSASINIDMKPRLREGTLADDLIEIDWGDGTVDTGLSTGTNSHTYGSSYTGWVIVYALGCCEINTLILDDGKWRSPLSALSHLSQLTYLRISGDNEMHGDLGDLPASLVTCIIEGNNESTWDFTRLPNLKNLTALGANTINAPKRSAEMVAFTRLILDGADRTASQVDDVLIAMSKIPEWDGTADIFLNYAGQAAPSPASSAAVSGLQAKGVTVNTN